MTARKRLPLREMSDTAIEAEMVGDLLADRWTDALRFSAGVARIAAARRCTPNEVAATIRHTAGSLRRARDFGGDEQASA